MQEDPDIQAPPALESERRRSGRIPCEDLSSSLGPVLDLSAEGARVILKKLRAPPVCARLSIEITGYGCSVVVDAEVMRSRRLGLTQHDLGLKFPSLTAQQRAIICDLVRTHSVRYSIVRALA
jgi:hypothetical protein